MASGRRARALGATRTKEHKKSIITRNLQNLASLAARADTDSQKGNETLRSHDRLQSLRDGRSRYSHIDRHRAVVASSKHRFACQEWLSCLGVHTHKHPRRPLRRVHHKPASSLPAKRLHSPYSCIFQGPEVIPSKIICFTSRPGGRTRA